MKVLKIKNRKEIINAFKEKKLLIIPTDTIYGFSCTIFDLESKKRIFLLKKRSENKYLSVLVPSIKEAKKILFFKKDYIPIFKKKESITIVGNVVSNFNNKYKLTNNNTIAIRITKLKWLRSILKEVGPIYTTSVNITGQEYARDFDELSKFNVDIIVYDGYLDNKPSSVYDGMLNKFVR